MWNLCSSWLRSGPHSPWRYSNEQSNFPGPAKVSNFKTLDSTWITTFLHTGTWAWNTRVQRVYISPEDELYASCPRLGSATAVYMSYLRCVLPCKHWWLWKNYEAVGVSKGTTVCGTAIGLNSCPATISNITCAWDISKHTFQLIWYSVAYAPHLFEGKLCNDRQQAERWTLASSC